MMESEIVNLTHFNLFYNIYDFPIEDAVIKDNCLTIRKSQTIKQEMVANGYREYFEYEVIDTFIFKCVKLEEQKIERINTNMNDIVINGKYYKIKEIEHIKEYID